MVHGKSFSDVHYYIAFHPGPVLPPKADGSPLGPKIAVIQQRILLVAERGLPELCGVALGDAEVLSCEGPVGKDGLDFAEHVAEDQAQLGQVAAVGRRLLEHLLLPVLEKLDRLERE